MAIRGVESNQTKWTSSDTVFGPASVEGKRVTKETRVTVNWENPEEQHVIDVWSTVSYGVFFLAGCHYYFKFDLPRDNVLILSSFLLSRRDRRNCLLLTNLMWHILMLQQRENLSKLTLTTAQDSYLPPAQPTL